MNTSHTPGPWRIGDAGATIFGPKTNSPAPEIVAFITRKTGLTDRQKANAHLIARAPAMDAALRAAFDYLCDNNAPQWLIDEVDAALSD